MAISPQQLTIYLHSAHRTVIFAIAQLSCSETGRCFVKPKRIGNYLNVTVHLCIGLGHTLALYDL